MIKHQRHDEIDKQQWDAMLLRCQDPLWYMQSWVLDISSPYWEALIDVEKEALMPLLWRRKFGVDYLYQPYAMQQQGVFAAKPTGELAEAFLNAVPSRFRYWDIHVSTSMRVEAHADLRVSNNTDQVLPLTGSIETLRAAYSQGHRRNLRKAGDGVGPVTSDLGVDEFVALFERTTAARFGGVPEGGLELLRRLMQEGKVRGQCRVLAIKDGGQAIAAVCLMEWEGRCILLKSANDEAGQERRAMFHLVDECIAQYAGTGRILDFAGSNTASVARFNAGFGARSTVYLHLVRNRLPAPLRWFKR